MTNISISTICESLQNMNVWKSPGTHTGKTAWNQIELEQVGPAYSEFQLLKIHGVMTQKCFKADKNQILVTPHSLPF